MLGKFRIAFWVWLSAFVCQIMLALIYYPSKEVFNHVGTIEGLYSFDGGAVRTASTTRIGGRVVFCGVSVMGPESACTSDLRGQRVTGKLVNLPTIFGPFPVLVEAAVNGKTALHYTPEQQIKYWRFLSVVSAIQWSLEIALGFFVIQQLIMFSRARKDKR
jgi:hypothetical protein